MDLKYVSAEEMRKVDEAAEKSGLAVEDMMENAGREIAKFVADLKPKKVLVLYGKGNNGGGALVAARYLLDRGFEVRIKGSKDITDIVDIKLKELREYKVKRGVLSWVDEGDVIIDGLIGYGLKGAPRRDFVEMIEKTNKARDRGAKIVSNDIPSGMNPNNGRAGKLTVNADYILTLALPKMGLKTAVKMGKVYLVDIGITKEIFQKAGVKGFDPSEIFKRKKVIRI